MVANKYFATLLVSCWRSGVFIKTQPICPQKKNTCICRTGGWVGETASFDDLEKRKIPYPCQHSQIWQSTPAYSTFRYATPASTEISKYLSISCMTFQSHCIMG